MQLSSSSTSKQQVLQMSQKQGSSHDHDHALLQQKSDKASEGSVFRPVTPRIINSQFSLNKPQSPISCYESQSIQSDDYIDPPWNAEDIADRLVTTESFTLDPITLRRELATMIILHEYPLSMIHHIGFKDFLSKLNPSFGMVSQETVENDIKKIFKFERCIAKSDLSSPSCGRVALTIKMWTSCDRNRKFLAITGHMIDSEWKRKTRMMRFANVSIDPTNESLAKAILECLSEYGVDVKLSSITVDNQASVDELANILVDNLSGKKFLLGGKLFQLPCFAHSVGLMVQDGFDVVSHVIEKIRDSIVFWTESQERVRNFKKAVHKCGISTTVSLVLDYDSKWSSTYLMVQQSVMHKDIFVQLRQQEPQYNSLPSEEEWSLIDEICQRLKVLYNVMKVFEEKPAACFYCEWICEIKVALTEWQNCEILEIKEMASKMLNKLDKYWSASRDFLGIAAVFHPKYRLFTLNHCFTQIYGIEAENETERIQRLCYDLFLEYKSSMPLEETDYEEQPEISVEGKKRKRMLDDKHVRFKSYLKEGQRKEPEKCELDWYLQPFFYANVEDTEIIPWWGQQKSNYPILQQIAKDILAIPICSVDPENLFYVGDKILNPNRSRLHPTMVETLMCTQSWVRNRKLTKAASSLTNKHSLGTIFDDANAVQGLIYTAKPAEPKANIENQDDKS